jgi:hypothetical protein
MSEHVYILAVDAKCSPAELEKIQQYVMTSRDFTSWWNHIPLIFMLETALTTDKIGEKLHTIVPDVRFLLTEVNLAESQGWLPEVSWKWIEKRALSVTPEQSSRF